MLFPIFSHSPVLTSSKRAYKGKCKRVLCIIFQIPADIITPVPLKRSSANGFGFKCLTPVNKTCLSRSAFASHEVQWDEFSVVRSFLVLFTDERNPSLRQSYSRNS